MNEYNTKSRFNNSFYKTLIYQAAPDGIFIHDHSGYLIEVNQIACDSLGYSKEELLSMNVIDFEQDFNLKQAQKEWSGIELGQQMTLYGHQKRKDGTIFPVEIHFGLFIFEGKRQYVVLCRNISEREKNKSRIERLSNLYKALSEINQTIVRMDKMEELFPLVCRCAVEFGNMKLAWVGKLNPINGAIYPVAIDGISQNYGLQASSSGGEFSKDSGMVDKAIKENCSVIVNDFFNSPITIHSQKQATNFGWNSAAAFPVKRNGKPFAVLAVYHEEINAFDNEIITLLERMSEDITFALDNFDREIQRSDGEESLHIAASVFETSREGIMITDANNLIITINRAFTRITGYCLQDVIGKYPNMLNPSRHDDVLYQTLWRKVNATGSWQGEIWNQRKNGEVYPQWLTINTVFNNKGDVQRRVAMFSDISQKKEAERKIWHQANFDSLTVLPNRKMFCERLDHDIKRSKKTKQSLALLFIDLDHFKEVNDTLGHHRGDLLLKEAAQRLSRCVRESDTVARLGGDEFTIVLNELDDNANIDRVVIEILRKISEPFQLGDDVVYVSASIGITLYPHDATSIEALFKNADQAMYAAKNQGRNRHIYFTPSMQRIAQERTQIANDLRVALKGNQFWVAYQPIVELATGKIYKAEALLRWQHPMRGQINPAEFIPIAEETGLINDIGNWIFREAMQQASIWRKSYNSKFQISVNRSPVQFRYDNPTCEEWPIQLKHSGLQGQSIIVEITEGLLMDSSDVIIDKLLSYRDAGIEISLDDFGTGYSSLLYLKKFKIDYLKIDQSFIRSLTPTSKDMALCEAIIVMAHKLGIKVIAEGVETKKQKKLLSDAECDFAQGYLFSKPIHANEFEKILEKVY